ncbi:hypothetical protein ACH95_08185 [Bacillus glycinifermentans]|uniref:Uncharacterized protein n=1 Tax=Bacillus glycinifermentans TaxID=1664069 RepID=A0A0J6HDS2_9BACI|nr:hypothetical protein [Bacillus glycinifermentans]ATH93889.1 hypothetical protein COP00_15665 [Bacillus glycinifermentans]KMM60888.1 hypothetical protein ACH95_08185 [Bacillus glycinifermentans]KRT89934.1 hypothetical protein AB447_204890 [Bacillus glycinifermentans]MEC0483602.1 hypothetical protein [Bacillus glycinifermentans]MEC0495204.1 hypothetical protein [Bacillus glycinifermentans]
MVEEVKEADVKDEGLLSLFPKTIRHKIQYRRNRLAKANAALQELEERTPEEKSPTLQRSNQFY